MRKNLIRTTIGMALKAIAFFIALIIGYLLTGTALSLIGTRPEPVICKDRKEIFLVSNGLHLDMIIPVDLLEKKLVEELNVPPSTRYLSFGWGDQAFYLQTPTWNELKPGVAIRSLFLRTDAAMHLTYYFRRYDSWHSLDICEEQLRALLTYISGSFARDSDQALIEIEGAGYTSYDRFYEANGYFHVFRTCNDWVNRGLKKAKVKTSLWSPFDFGVLYHLGRASRNDQGTLN